MLGIEPTFKSLTKYFSASSGTKIQQILYRTEFDT